MIEWAQNDNDREKAVEARPQPIISLLNCLFIPFGALPVPLRPFLGLGSPQHCVLQRIQPCPHLFGNSKHEYIPLRALSHRAGSHSPTTAADSAGMTCNLQVRATLAPAPTLVLPQQV